MRHASKLILNTVAVATFFLAGAKLQAKPPPEFMPKMPFSGQGQGTPKTSDSVKTTDSTRSQQKNDTLQTVPQEVKFGEYSVPEEKGGGVLLLTSEKLYYTVKGSDGEKHIYSYACDILFAGHGGKPNENTKLFLSTEMWQGTYWMILSSPDASKGDNYQLWIKMPSFSDAQWLGAK